MAKISICYKYADFDLNIFYFIYMKRDWAEHRCYVIALSLSMLILSNREICLFSRKIVIRSWHFRQTK